MHKDVFAGLQPVTLCTEIYCHSEGRQ